MSSPGSAVTVELPRWPLADRLTVALLFAVALVVEAVAARHPGVSGGLGVAAAVLLAVAFRFQRWRQPCRLVFAPGANQLQLADGSERPFVVGAGSRLLGSSVVLHWRSPGRSGAVWLTAADLPRETLRSLAVHLVAGR
jgi:hypothetical protein